MQPDFNKLQSDVFHVARLQHDAAIQAIEEHTQATLSALANKPNTDVVIAITKVQSDQIRNIETATTKFRQDYLAAISQLNEALKGTKEQFVDASVYETDMDIVQRNMEQLSMQLHKLREDMQAQGRNLLNTLKVELDNFWQKIQEKPSEIATFTSEVNAKTDAATYQAISAVNHIKGYDHRFMIIEKKIESIFIMLKKLEQP